MNMETARRELEALKSEFIKRHELRSRLAELAALAEADPADALRAQSAALATKLAAAQAANAATEGEIDAAKGKVTELNDRMTATFARKEELSSQEVALQEEVSGHRTCADTLDELVAADDSLTPRATLRTAFKKADSSVSRSRKRQEAAVKGQERASIELQAMRTNVVERQAALDLTMAGTPRSDVQLRIDEARSRQKDEDGKLGERSSKLASLQVGFFSLSLFIYKFALN